MTMLQLSKIAKSYNGDAVLREVDFRLAVGAACAITGPSGCGKSTLLNIIGTLDKPDSGQVILDGKELSQLDENELARVRNQTIGFVFQLHHLLPQCTALENVLLPVLANGGISKEHQERARRLLDRVGLGARLNHFSGQLSGGERQRVAVVRALMNAPKLLLADEPTGALDGAAAENLAQLLLELNREEGVALIVVTHAHELAKQLPLHYELRDGVLKMAYDEAQYKPATS
jgi:lipoprotein-releasing system ATP-binding protein